MARKRKGSDIYKDLITSLSRYADRGIKILESMKEKVEKSPLPERTKRNILAHIERTLRNRLRSRGAKRSGRAQKTGASWLRKHNI